MNSRRRGVKAVIDCIHSRDSACATCVTAAIDAAVLEAIQGVTGITNVVIDGIPLATRTTNAGTAQCQPWCGESFDYELFPGRETWSNHMGGSRWPRWCSYECRLARKPTRPAGEPSGNGEVLTQGEIDALAAAGKLIGAEVRERTRRMIHGAQHPASPSTTAETGPLNTLRAEASRATEVYASACIDSFNASVAKVGPVPSAQEWERAKECGWFVCRGCGDEVAYGTKCRECGRLALPPEPAQAPAETGHAFVGLSRPPYANPALCWHAMGGAYCRHPADHPIHTSRPGEGKR